MAGPAGSIGRHQGPTSTPGNSHGCSSRWTCTRARRSTWTPPCRSPATSSPQAPSSRNRSDMTLRLLVAHSAAERNAAREVEAEVFLQAFGNTSDVMEQEYGPYEDRSRFVTVLDDAVGSALGVARLILPDDAGALKTLIDVAGEPWHLSVPDTLRAEGLSGRPVWDVASLAVDRRYRSGAAGAEVMLALCHGIYR